MAAEFDPQFYTGGPTQSYLPLLHDVVSIEKPELIVTLGLGDGQVHLAMCQIAGEASVQARIVGVRRAAESEPAEDDPGWTAARDLSANSYFGISELLDNKPEVVAQQFNDRSIDVLFIDDTDVGEVIRNELACFEKKLKASALVMVHGIDLERHDAPGAAWSAFAREKARVEFHDGIGLGIATEGAAVASSKFRQALFAQAQQKGTATSYSLRASALKTRVELSRMVHRAEILSSRQISLEVVMSDRTKAQGIMEEQAKTLRETMKRFTILQSDRAEAQAIMEAQAVQIDRSHVQIQNFKKLISTAKAACRKKGRCFDIPKGPKPKRSTGEKIQREIARVPRNLRRLLRRPATDAVATPSAVSVDERYAKWIAQHEPTTEQFAAQRRESAEWDWRPKISVLIPVYQTAPKFLGELFQSLAAQSYSNWEGCIVDGGSRSQGTIRALKRWAKNESRIRVKRLPKNLGVAENTNEALGMATGDFVVFADHDDTLAPFAFYEVAAAVRAHPEADFFYSDEDRLSEAGMRSRPFFKPEWSPEFLYSFMYTGHLSIYRTSFALKLGGLRKEFDLSQDYDFALRASERAREIVHIPHVLYHWREHPTSGAAGGKPHARKTNLAALADAVKRRGMDAEVLEYPTANRVRMQLGKLPRVSVIIPTDSPIRLEKCARELPGRSQYAETEYIIVTKSMLIRGLHEFAQPISPQVRLVAFDEPFNFSAKCNAGAKAATGERLVFLNDDVESAQSDWIENVIEPLENSEVGAVSPKLLYSTGRIQHAGLVTGVRGLVGTAMHQWNSDSVDYSNFAQSMRNVSALSAACLAMRRDLFFEVGGFDEVNAPIAHSDIDLCFKIRERGLRCVYTPFATLTHYGHASIGVEEEKIGDVARDKCSIFLLQRWPAFTCRDPYFTDHMREWLYADSPMPIQMFATENRKTGPSRRDLLFVTHDLSLSGAPIILSHLAKWCKAQGVFVTLMSPADGPARAGFVEAGITVIIDSVIGTGYDQFIRFGQGSLRRSHESFAQFARNFDCLIASTIMGAPLIQDARAESIPHFWWIHEGLVGDHYLGRYPIVARTIGLADFIVTPDNRSRRIYQPFSRHPIHVLRYGVPDVERTPGSGHKSGPLRFLLLGTIEHRKGQETLLQALTQLPQSILEQSLFQIVGRPHDAKIAAKVRAARSAHLEFSESLSHEKALALIRETDVMVCTSHDETGPLTLIEAMAVGKPILSTRVGAVGETLVPDKEGVFVEPGDAAGLADAIIRLVSDPELRQRLALNSRAAYEKYFSFDRFGNEFLELVEKAIAGGTSKQVPAEDMMTISLA